VLYYIGSLRDCYTGMKGAWELGSIENFNYNYIQSSCPKIGLFSGKTVQTIAGQA
jgi:hypothetical protein